VRKSPIEGLFSLEELVPGTRVDWHFGGDVMRGTVSKTPRQDWVMCHIEFDDGGGHEVYVGDLRKLTVLDALADI
jgi:hypothetical protein